MYDRDPNRNQLQIGERSKFFKNYVKSIAKGDVIRFLVNLSRNYDFTDLVLVGVRVVRWRIGPPRISSCARDL